MTNRETVHRNVPMRIVLILFALSIASPLAAQPTPLPCNLLQNPAFQFHAFNNHRDGTSTTFESHNVAFWNTDQWGDVRVVREAHVAANVRPTFSTKNLVEIQPGKRFWQFFTLPEVGLAHGERLSLSIFGHQRDPHALRVRLQLMKLDSEDGTWSPSEFGHFDKRVFAKQSRGELVVAKSYDTASEQVGTIRLLIENADILGHFQDRADVGDSDEMNTIGVRVLCENKGTKPVWIYAPSLCQGSKSIPNLLAGRPLTPHYQHIPRTMQKLWKGKAIHVLVMGSSIDHADANPRILLYDEDPKSKTFKQPIGIGGFEPENVDRPDLAGYCPSWNQYFGYAGRLRRELMRKYNLPASKIFLNIMARGGSSVGEAHSGLDMYVNCKFDDSIRSELAELHPEIFSRPEGPGPDLVIFGSGANTKTDTPDEVAVFEGTIRYIQRHAPHAEFLFCQFQKRGGYTPNPGDMMALSLRYQMPSFDFGKAYDDLTRWCNQYALTPIDGHPQAAGHYVWFKNLERAFECWDPIVPGQAQSFLPDRLHRNTYGWEGEMIRFDKASPRLRGAAFVFEDTAINTFAIGSPRVDGQVIPGARWQAEDKGLLSVNPFNSHFPHGRLRLGDRHIVEFQGAKATLKCVDAKVCPNRRWIGVDSVRWRLDEAAVTPFVSDWGAPFGTQQATLQPGQAFEIDAVATDVSLAYVDREQGGKLRVLIDGREQLLQPTNAPFIDIAGQEHLMENRKGILALGYGWHRIRLEAVDGSVDILGLFTYDSRSNRKAERRLTGFAAPGETIQFSRPFKTRPIVFCNGGLAAVVEDVTTTSVTFGGQAVGGYEVIGE